jgi:hypothetical protein
LIQIFYPDFSIKEYILGTKRPINKDEENNILMDLEMYIFLFLGVVLLLIVLTILYMALKKLREKIVEFLPKQKN